MPKAYTVGTRASKLALRQVEEASGLLRKFYPCIRIEVKTIDTYGDRDKNTPISDIEGSDFFTKEIDDALLRGEIDFAVHSAKDLPDIIPDGLQVAAVNRSINPYDVLVSKSGLKLDELKPGAKIGTSSLRRKTQLKKYRNDFQIVDIRGNIEERLSILEKTDLDAIVIAAAGLIRLGLEERITQKIPFDILSPHPLQGALVVVARNEDIQLLSLLSKIDSREKILA